LQCHPGLQAADCLQEDGGSIVYQLLGGQWRPQIGAFGKIKLPRHDADDLIRRSVECDRLSDDLRISTEALTPAPIVQHDDSVIALIDLFFSERAAERGVCAEERKEIARYSRTLDLDGITLARQDVAVTVNSRRHRENVFKSLSLG